MTLSDKDLQDILDREYKGLLESGLRFSAQDVVDDLVKELLKLREQTKPKISFDLSDRRA